MTEAIATFINFDSCKHANVLTSTCNDNIACKDCGVFWRKHGEDLTPTTNDHIIMDQTELKSLLTAEDEEFLELDTCCPKCGPIGSVSTTDDGNRTIICLKCKSFIRKNGFTFKKSPEALQKWKNAKDTKNYLVYGDSSDYATIN